MADSITLQNISDTAIIDNDILGQICFAAPNESSGTDSILISASVFARSEGTFAADNNATELVFVTGASESAAPGASNGDMTLSSAGLLTVADDIVIKSAGTIGGANDVDLLTLGNGVLTVAGEIEGTSLDISGDGDIDGALEVGSIELGHASDTTIARASAGQITVEGTAVVLAGAVTGITSLLATDIKIGEDDQTKIDFEDADKINFYAGNEKQLILEDGALYPGSDNIIDLGKSDNEFKDAYFDGTVTADAFAGPLTGNVTGNVSGSAATVTGAAQSNITSLGTLTTLTVDSIIINGTTIGHTSDTDAITIAAEGDVTFSKAIKPAAPAAASGTSGIVVLDCDTTNHFTITTGGNITGWNFTNASVGQRIVVRVTNGASHTVAFSASGDGDVVYFPGGTEPTLTTSGGIDVYGFLCVAADTFDGFILGQDIKA